MIAELLSQDGFVRVNKNILKKYGVNMALIVGELCSEYVLWKKENRLKDGYFYSRQTNIEDNTGLSPRQQKHEMDILELYGVLNCKYLGKHFKYYKINEDKLSDLINLKFVSIAKNANLNSSLESQKMLISIYSKNKEDNNKNKKERTTPSSSLNTTIDTNKRNYIPKPIALVSMPTVSTTKLTKYEVACDLIHKHTYSAMVEQALMDYLAMKNAQPREPKFVVNEKTTEYLIKKIDSLLEDHTDKEVEEYIRTAIRNKWASIFEIQEKKQSSFIQLKESGHTMTAKEKEAWEKEVKEKIKQGIIKEY